MRTGHARIRVHPSPFRSYFRVCLQQQLPLTKLCTTCTRCVRRYQANTHYYVYPNNDTIITKGQPTVTYRTTWHEIYPRLILPALPSPHPHCLFHTSSLSPQSCISYSLSSSHTHTHARTHTHTHTRTHTHTLCVYTLAYRIAARTTGDPWQHSRGVDGILQSTFQQNGGARL